MRASDLNSNFTDARSDGLHRFPVVWIQPLLHAPQLEPSQPSSRAGNARKSLRELPSQMSALSGMGYRSVYKFLYFVATKRAAQLFSGDPSAGSVLQPHSSRNFE